MYMKYFLSIHCVRDGAEGKIQMNGLLTSHHHETKSEIIIGRKENGRKVKIGWEVRKSRKERTYVGSKDWPLQKENLIVTLQN